MAGERTPGVPVNQPRSQPCAPLPYASHVREDLRDHQRGGRPARGRDGRRRRRVRVRPVAAPGRRRSRSTTSPGACRPRSSPSACSATSTRSGSSRSSTSAGLKARPAPRPRDAGDGRRGRRERCGCVIKAFAGRRSPQLADAGDVRRRRRSCSTRPTPGLGRGVRLVAGRASVPDGLRLILAGGLDPDNVADADRRPSSRGASTCRPASSGRRAARTRVKVKRVHRARPGRPRPCRTSGPTSCPTTGPTSERPVTTTSTS